MWKEIINDQNINDFMDLFGYFHDACLKEIKYVSGAYVGEDLAMNPINNLKTVEIIFQRQDINPTVIVMRFLGLKELHLQPCRDGYTCEINEVTMFFKNGYIYWADCDKELENEIENYKGTWLYANKVQWKIIDKQVGNKEIFIATYK